MAELVNGQIKLKSGQLQSPKEGEWYEGRRYLNGQLLNANEFEPGKQVSSEVRAQSAAQQGVSLQSFDEYLANAGVQNITSSITPSYSTGAISNNISSGIQSNVDAARKALEERLTADQVKNEAEMAAAKQRETEALGEVKKLTTPFREDLEKTDRAKYGTETVLSDQKALLGELEQLLTEGNSLIKQQKEVTGLAAVRNPRIQKTMEDVAARAGVIQAVVSLQNTYLANAYQSIDRSVNAIAQDRQDQLSYYEVVLNLSNRDIISLDASSKKIAEERVSLLKGDLDNANTIANYIKEKMIDPNTALLMAQGGVTLNDSVETINSKLSMATYAKEVKDLNNSMAADGYTEVYDASQATATITDSAGKKYYYKKAKTASSGEGIDIMSFVNENLGKAGIDYSKKESISDAQFLTLMSEVDSVVAPNVSPASGIGSVYYDALGRKWVYERSGWVLAG